MSPNHQDSRASNSPDNSTDQAGCFRNAVIIAACITTVGVIVAALIETLVPKVFDRIFPTSSPSAPTSSMSQPVGNNPPITPSTPSPQIDLSGAWHNWNTDAEYQITASPKHSEQDHSGNIYQFDGRRADGVTAQGTLTLIGLCFQVNYTTNKPSKVMVIGALSQDGQQMTGFVNESPPPPIRVQSSAPPVHTYLRWQEGQLPAPIDLLPEAEQCHNLR